VKKPVTSVTVVRKIDEAVAGSRPSEVSAMGTLQPARDAVHIEISAPYVDARRRDERNCDAVRRTHGELFSEHAQPVRGANFSQRKASHRDGHRLRAGVAALAGDDG
jgi:hypothetical protein